MQSTQDAIHRSLSIELLSMHPFAPFGQIELAAGREGEDEVKAAYQSAKTGPGATKPDRRFQMLARQSATYVSLCLWIYGTLAANNAPSSAGGIPSIMSQQFTLDTDEKAKIQQWINLNRGIPAICKSLSSDGAEHGDQILLFPTQQIMICLQELLPHELLTDKSHVLIASVYDLMSALSTARPGLCLS
ncbi:hypothetical protein G4B84_004150 [Aspergillus flavus NRRL3357]|nr:uncharacterized protein G4B84_004150 [Aspergillus flavus NRRL3357]QMW28861.1 hypothetical protein G4B84_004150 [Aspergillus flavus NRRL3357]